MDHRNDVARARDFWFQTDVAEKLASGSASGVYLRNRLEQAFIAGWSARGVMTHKKAEEYARKSALDMLKKLGLGP